MNTRKLYTLPDGTQTQDRPQTDPTGKYPIPEDNDNLLRRYWPGITITLVTDPPTPEEQKQLRIQELKGYIASGYAYWVTQYIREQYDLDAELAIQRQRATKADDFTTYFNYCEDCKTRAQSNLAAWQKELEELEPQTNADVDVDTAEQP